MRWAWMVMLMVGCAHDPAEPLQTPRPKTRPREVAQTTTAPIVEIVGENLSPIAKGLAQIETFSLGDMGYAGNKSEGEKLARELATEPDAIEVFDRLLAQPNRPARLYAYWALRTLDVARANQARSALAADRTRIKTAFGCFGAERETMTVVADIDRLAPMPRP